MIGSPDARRRVLKRWVFAALAVARANERAARRHGAHDRLLILNLHSVSPHTNPYGPSLHPDAFAELLDWLQPRTTISLLGNLPGPAERDPRRPLLVLSFDDGLKDFVEHAMPVLASRDLHANQNVIGRSLETEEAPWAIRVLDQLGAASTDVIRRLRVPGFDRTLSGDDAFAKERFGAALTNHLKALAPTAREPVWAALQDELRDVAVERPTRMMSAAEVTAAIAGGHEVGSHSYSHESMEYLDDADFLDDFRRSRALLLRAGCDDVAVYAFPNGSHRPRQAELLREEGVRSALLVGERASRPEAPVHTRLTLRGGSAAELRARAVAGRS